tara:strand:+ start:816 stop:1466 length:651 start_codon:yes stop_codon:yes gene_type:complete
MSPKIKLEDEKEETKAIKFKSFIAFALLFASINLKPRIEFNEIIPSYYIYFSSVILLFILITCSVNDIKYLNITNKICIFGYTTGLIITGIKGLYLSSNIAIWLIKDHFLASIYALFLMNTISLVGSKIYRKNALGIGDAKFSCMGGAWIGSSGILLALGIAFISAGIFALILKKYRRKWSREFFAFCPFISLGIWIVWLFESLFVMKQLKLIWGI